MQNFEVSGSTVLLLRRTLGQLEDSLLKEFHKSVPWRELGARYNDQKHRVFWPNGSVLRFGYCLAAGTLVDTDHGQIPIERIVAGDLVITRRGLKRVRWVGQTGHKEIVRVGPLGITREHRIWTDTLDFVEVERIIGIGVSECQKASEKTGNLLILNASYSKACRIADTRIQSTIARGSISQVGAEKRKSLFTWQFGKVLTVQFLRGLKSIIPMETPYGTFRKIWKRFCSALIAVCTRKNRRGWELSSEASNSTALDAGHNSLDFDRAECFATLPVERVSIVETGEVVPVYDLQVEDAHEFFADGILVHNCENENDVYQYQGGEYLFIGLDELTHFTLKQWQFLTSRNRHPTEFATMAGATNPGNIGHTWVKALWIDKKPAPGMDEPEKYDPKDYDFIRALISDNPIYAHDANYLKTLDGLGKALRTAMLEGLWDQFAGQYFDIFNVERHVGLRQGSQIVNRGTVYEIQDWWPKWLSLDWGFKHNFAAYWNTTAPDGRHITYREWVDNELTPGMLGQGLVERSVDSSGRAERIQQFFLSPDAFADRTGQSTIAEQIREVACREKRLPMPAEASDDRVGGWQLCYQLLEQDKWLITENCEKLIDSLPTLIRDEKRPEDIKKVEGDDEADSARYGLYSRLGAAKAPPEVRAAKLVENVTDMTERAMKLSDFYEKERRTSQPIPVGGRHGGGRRWRPGQGR